MVAACSSGDRKAAELLDTAGFEEKQHNFEHATKLYEEIVSKFPASPAANVASTRLNTLKSRKP
jgi:TolA-binding protein